MVTEVKEAWLPVVGYEGYYEVSDLGRVRSLPRTIVDRAGATRTYPGKILKAVDTPKRWHPFVNLCVEREQRTPTVPFLVLTAFVGPRPEGMQVCHNDGDRLNSQLTNLRWDTPSENRLDVVRHGHDPRLNKTYCPAGHPYAGANLVIVQVRGRRVRVCRTCRIAAGSRYKARRRAQRAA